MFSIMGYENAKRVNLMCEQRRLATVLKVRGLIVISNDFIVLMRKPLEKRIQRHFGERVRDLRKRKGLSQEALALGCDLDRTYVGGVERGERNISLINIHKISRALGVSPCELVSDPETAKGVGS